MYVLHFLSTDLDCSVCSALNPAIISIFVVSFTEPSSFFFIIIIGNLLEVYRAYCPLELSDLLISLFSDWIQTSEACVSKTVEWELKWKKPVGFANNGKVTKTRNGTLIIAQSKYVCELCFLVISTRQNSLSWSMRGEIADKPTMRASLPSLTFEEMNSFIVCPLQSLKQQSCY